MKYRFVGKYVRPAIFWLIIIWS